jgi:hypothetical protein
VIGSDPKADIVVSNNISISRKHALLEFQKGALFLTCFGQNSVFLNGCAVHNLQRTQLQENDLIKLSESGPELLVEEIALEKKAANEKKKRHATRVRRGVYLLFLLLTFITFVILYMDTSFNLRIFELIGGGNFFLKDFPLFNLWGDKNDKTAVPAEPLPLSWITEQATVEQLNAQLQQPGKHSSEPGPTMEQPQQKQILNQSTDLMLARMMNQSARFADAVFLFLGTDATNRILTLGTAYAIKKSGLFCLPAASCQGAERFYLKNKKYYFPAKLVYQDKEQRVALLSAPLVTKPLPIRIINNKDIGIDVYALDASGVMDAYMEPGSAGEQSPGRSGNGGSERFPVPAIKFKKGMLSGLLHDSTFLVSDLGLAEPEPGRLLLDNNSAVIGIFVPPLPAERETQGDKPVIVHIKVCTGFNEASVY